jgi:hypothetical protein
MVGVVAIDVAGFATVTWGGRFQANGARACSVFLLVDGFGCCAEAWTGAMLCDFGMHFVSLCAMS